MTKPKETKKASSIIPRKKRLSPKDKEISRLKNELRESQMIRASQADSLMEKDKTINAFQQKIYRLEEVVKDPGAADRIKTEYMNKTYPMNVMEVFDSIYSVHDIKLNIPRFDPQGHWTEWEFNAPVLIASGRPILFRVLWGEYPCLVQNHISSGKAFDRIRYSLDEHGGTFLSLGFVGEEMERI